MVQKRYYSLDVFRGATVALMILVNNPGSWSHIYSPLAHAQWHGLTPTDLVFPFFLFAVGNSLFFVMPRFEADGPFVFWKKVLKRTLVIFGIGLLLNWSPFVRWEGEVLVAKGWTWTDANGERTGIRIPGVLQRIALCYFFASLIIYYLKGKGAFLAGLLLLLLYWLLCIIGHPADPYSLTGWFGTPIDKAVFGSNHLYRGEIINGRPYVFDPEGLMSTLPAVAQVIFGYLVGDYIQKKGQWQELNIAGPMREEKMYSILTGLFIGAMALLFAGYCWSFSFPINKKIWTSSYVVVTTGLAMCILALLIYAIEIKGAKGGWTRFFDVFGKNPLFIFVLSGLIPRLQAIIRIPSGAAEAKQQFFSPFALYYEKVDKLIAGAQENASLFYALTMVLFYWAIAWWMDKKRLYIKV